MAHSLIPIVVGYIFAHYLSYLIERGQLTFIRLADPFGRGWNVLGLGNVEPVYLLSQHPAVLSTIKVSCVVIGHIVAVIAAHDKALRLLPPQHQLTWQLAMMLVMVGYTFLGLVPIVRRLIVDESLHPGPITAPGPDLGRTASH